MAPGSPATPGPAERPTRAAQLKIKAEPARVKVNARRWVTAEGTVPPGDARHLITTFGIVGSVVTGTAGAVLTLRIAPGLTWIALVELVLALSGAMLIAACGRAQREDRGQEQVPAGDGQPITHAGSNNIMTS